MKTLELIEIIAAGMMAISVLLVIWHRIKTGKGVGARSIQLVAVVLIIPTILILSLEKVLDSQTTGTLFGAMSGYLFAEIGRFKPRQKTVGDSKKPEIK